VRERRHLAIGKVNPKIVGIGAEIQKIVSYHASFVTKTKYEVFYAVCSIPAHDVPKDWLSANVGHGFWLAFGLALKPRTLPAAENDSGHRSCRILCVIHLFDHWRCIWRVIPM
jgi:hypothetical protein